MNTTPTADQPTTSEFQAARRFVWEGQIAYPVRTTRFDIFRNDGTFVTRAVTIPGRSIDPAYIKLDGQEWAIFLRAGVLRVDL